MSRRCSHEIAPYTGNGVDPPTCGAPATHTLGAYPYCEWHYRIEMQRGTASISDGERDAQVRALQFVRNLTPQSIDQVIEDVRSKKVRL